METVTQETVAKPPLTIRLPHDLHERLEKLVNDINALRKLGKVTKTDIIVESLDAHIPVIEVRELETEYEEVPVTMKVRRLDANGEPTGPTETKTVLSRRKRSDEG